MKTIKTLLAACSLAFACNVQAQLFSAYAEGATNPNAWLTDVTDGSFVEFDDPTTNAVADDEENRRIYYVVEGGTIFDMRLQYRPVSDDGTILPGVNVGFMYDQFGLVIERTKGLAFGNGVLYLSNSGTGRNGAPRGLYSVEPDTGIATFLFDPKFQGKSIVFTGLGFNDADGLLYGVAQVTGGYSLLSIDPASKLITEAVALSEAPGDFESFDGVGIGDGRVYLTFGPSAVDIQVYNLGSGLFEDPLPNPRRGENGSGGATFASFLQGSGDPPAQPPPPAPSLSEVSVSRLVLKAQTNRKGRVQGRAVVLVVDDVGNRIEGATVTGTFSGAYTGSGSAVTNAKGRAVVKSGNRTGTVQPFAFCVDDLQVQGFRYNAAANGETCDSL